jgi:hypothetical protein
VIYKNIDSRGFPTLDIAEKVLGASAPFWVWFAVLLIAGYSLSLPSSLSIGRVDRGRIFLFEATHMRTASVMDVVDGTRGHGCQLLIRFFVSTSTV